MWLWGGMLYVWMISLIFYRYTFHKFAPGRSLATVLDQHGGDGYLDARRLASDRQRAFLTTA
jgi:hypothetical protein